MKKIVNLTLENRFIYYFPIDFDLKKLNQLKPKFIGESAEDFILYTRRELDAEDIFDSHCVYYETLDVDFVEDNKSEDFGNWDFNQLEMF